MRDTVMNMLDLLFYLFGTISCLAIFAMGFICGALWGPEYQRSVKEKIRRQMKLEKGAEK